MSKTQSNHPHPGEFLRADVLEPLKLTISDAADWLGVSRVALSRVLNGHAALSIDLARRLESAGIGRAYAWVRLQTNYDLAVAASKPLPAVSKFAEWSASRTSNASRRAA